MFMVLAFLLAVSWLIAVLPGHVTAPSVHVMLGLVAFSALLHTLHVRHYRGHADELPPDAVK
jgi:hypothetical protein